MKRTGIYCLVGLDPDAPGKERVLAGEGDSVWTRLVIHDREESKDFWARIHTIARPQEARAFQGKHLILDPVPMSELKDYKAKRLRKKNSKRETHKFPLPTCRRSPTTSDSTVSASQSKSLPEGVIIEGHQRVRAYQLPDRNEIDVIVCDGLGPGELKERFIKANPRHVFNKCFPKEKRRLLLTSQTRRRQTRTDNLYGSSTTGSTTLEGMETELVGKGGVSAAGEASETSPAPQPQSDGAFRSGRVEIAKADHFLSEVRPGSISKAPLGSQVEL